ncbi:MAG: GNAT family N-acetyltransferase [Ignavibacteriales bacterium]|jgi:ribosomal-protein-alanine N-acetyltransferase|nr:GNAT family N-acetyltransferase [Ignavibacteriales bacterium]
MNTFLNRTLSTERCFLRKPVADDAENFFNLRSDPAVNQYIDRKPVANLDDAREFITKTLAGTDESKWAYWVIQRKVDKAFMGTICLWNFSDDRKTAEVGFELLPRFQGVGYASESLIRVMELGFIDLGLSSLTGYVQSVNTPSINLMKTHHFSLKEDFIENSAVDGKPIKNSIYLITKETWKANRE